FPFIAGSLADPVLDGKYGDDFSSYFHFYQYWVFNGLFIFALPPAGCHSLPQGCEKERIHPDCFI
ncbi:hypothetical protein O1399_21715, partial [Bacteroides fragilis]|uniref:hypothetical protein n=1 Tax=Bacteroides fragilis TaxID=817 RepID=UPI0022AA6861